ncbi:hypothetical protein Tco_1478689, partial [Tanacetum coccineum]
VPQPSDPSENVTDEAVYKELGDSLVRAATTASRLEAEQDSGGAPRYQETMRDTTARTRFESVSKHSNDSLLTRGNTLQSDKDRLKLDELMELCTTLQNRVLDLGKTKTTQQNEIASLKRRVKKLEKKIAVKEVNDEVNVVKEVAEVINTAKLIVDVAQVSAAGNVVSTASDATTVSAATTTTATITTVDDITLAQALMEIKSTKPKVKGVVIQELGESTTTISS